jgi:hypothetical protein
MKVETYEVEEVKGELETMAADSEAIELCQKLNLQGQLSRTNIGTATRNPYRLMSCEEMFVYSLLCPKKVELRQYKDGPIPLRVLQVAARRN